MIPRPFRQSTRCCERLSEPLECDCAPNDWPDVSSYEPSGKYPPRKEVGLDFVLAQTVSLNLTISGIIALIAGILIQIFDV